MLIIAFDPGTTGAMTAMGYKDPSHIEIHDLPIIVDKIGKRNKSRIDARALNMLVSETMVRFGMMEPVMFVIEDVRLMPNAVLASSGIASLMHTKGVIEGVVSRWRYPVHFVNPRTWKKALGLDSKKTNSIDVARELYPGVSAVRLTRVKDHNRAESLLLAHWAKWNLI
jgi:crossover junction endodeoxyribonuclease RuvC